MDKRSKGSHKEYYRWMVTEIEDFSPQITPEDPLKKFSHLLNTNALTSTPQSHHQKLVVVNPSQTAKTIKYKPNFSLCKYWSQFPTKVIENLIRLLDLKDMIMLICTCKYFKEELDQESMWKTLQIRDFFPLRSKSLRDDAKERASEKLYYKFLYLSRVSGIPYHSGYFKAYGSPDVVELADSIVDFFSPQDEMIKKYAGEIFMRNQCKILDLKLSWLKEKNEICLWSGNASLEFKKPEKGNEEVETVNKFYPCFIKRYSMVDIDEEIQEVFFLEDKYLVVKLKKKVKVIFRILNLEEELHSIAKGLQPATPFDYSFVLKDNGDSLTDIIKMDEFGVDFIIDQEKECDIKVNLLSGDRAVFYTKDSVKPSLIFWDLKKKKKIDIASVELKKPLKNILLSKKSEVIAEKIKLILLDKNMNVYCASLCEKDGFVLNQTITLSTPTEEQEEEKMEKQQDEKLNQLKELEAKNDLNSGKRARCKNKANPHYLYLFNNPPKHLKELDQKFESKTRKYYHEIFDKNEEWLILHFKNRFYFVNLDEEKIQEFSADQDLGLLDSGNWTVYEDNLLVTNPSKILYYRINIEDRKIHFRFCRQLEIGNIVKQWVLLDSCFTVMIFTHTYGLGLTARATIVVTSTQEFLYHTDPAFNSISYQVQADQFIRVPDRWENKYREIDIKFEDSKLLVSTEKANFYFDMNLSVQPYSKVYLNGWVSNSSIQNIKYPTMVKIAAEPEATVEEGEMKPVKPKMVNYTRLGGNPNTMNAKEKSNGWRKGGKSQVKKDEDKEYKVLKGKGDKYHKNIRQGQRSEKVN